MKLLSFPQTALISAAPGCCTMVFSHVVFLPDSMQTGQHSPAGVKGNRQCTVGQVMSSHTTRPPVHRQVTQGFGDQTAWSNMVSPWYAQRPGLPETTEIVRLKITFNEPERDSGTEYKGRRSYMTEVTEIIQNTL